MKDYINKSALVDWIKKQIDSLERNSGCSGIFGDYQMAVYDKLFSFINTLEVKTPYEQCVQYDSIKAGIQAHAETYSFNIESELFNQLTKEQQELWRKEIEQACISGGEVGVELARDPRYKENLEVKEINNVWNKASDLPKAEAGRSILLIEDNGHAELLKSPSEERLFYFRPVNLKMWAYVDELLSITTHFDVKKGDLEQEIQQHINDCLDIKFPTTDIELIKKDVAYTARKFFELGLKSKGE